MYKHVTTISDEAMEETLVKIGNRINLRNREWRAINWVVSVTKEQQLDASLSKPSIDEK